MKHYDVLVVGSGPGGEKAAMQAAKLGKTVAVIERKPFIGGAGLHTGTLPSKTLRESALMLASLKQKAPYGFHQVLPRDVTLQELMHKKGEVTKSHMEVIIDQFTRNNIEIIYGDASLVDANTLLVKKRGGENEEIKASVIVLSPGTRPVRPKEIPFDNEHIYDSDTILELDKIPGSLTILGGGVIGCEYACIFACLGVKVTLIEKKSVLLPFADKEIVEALMYWMRHSGIVIKSGEEVVGIEIEKQGRVVTRLKSGKLAASEKLLYTMGRVGNTDSLNLAPLSIELGDRGLIKVNQGFQTSVPNIYAIGDAIGFPSLASTSREQGRRAVCNAFSKEGVTCEVVTYLPFAIYTIPEISMVGETEEELTAKGVPYEVGCANFQEVLRGQISGDVYGMLKLLFRRDNKRILGVHIIGEKASELVHIGQAVMSFGGTIDYFKDAVFNYPTLSDAYKQAALNGLNRL
ncbi:MAG: Si-specific NAD(P)(+) transhydrogenase [Thermodesulfobacteriota bacterium]